MELHERTTMSGQVWGGVIPHQRCSADWENVGDLVVGAALRRLGKMKRPRETSRQASKYFISRRETQWECNGCLLRFCTHTHTHTRTRTHTHTHTHTHKHTHTHTRAHAHTHTRTHAHTHTRTRTHTHTHT